MSEEKDTAIVGAEPTDKDTADKTGAEPVKDAKTDSSTDAVPFDKDPRWKSARLAEKALNDLMKANEVEDYDSLKELVKSGKKVFGKIEDIESIDELKEKADKHDKWVAHWKREEELRRRGAETPEETIARLNKKLEEKEEFELRKQQSEREAKQAKESVERYEREVSSQLESFEDLTPEVREVIAWSLGKGNECNEIDINDRKAVKKIVNDGVKKYNDLVKTIKEQGIKEYLAGKASIPSVPTNSGTVATSKVEPPKGFRAMREAAKEMIMGGKK